MEKRKIYRWFGGLLLVLGVVINLFFLFSSFNISQSIAVDIASQVIERDSYQKISKDYLAILEIPAIQVKNYLYDLDSPLNHVNKNVFVVKGSTMPTIEYSNLILAAHSGFGSKAFFHNLDKLQMQDIANIYYEGKIYTYKLVDIYQEEKDGTITIHREPRKKHLILITCDKVNKNLQNVFVFEILMS